ncbi:hypothetical protein QNH46_19350 [Paenibacillus woosongensis]|uniref:Uncharacterized protein n=1 Tax=Paenibacillus woosongensis TaxID=307580 RepID=A0AA95KV98_9BACL|nr:hypothetical protein [Paenibacillus woosongensis]WHX48235.1 hypothetical protein QNH46_19350 [Paenibacillus woosongensis]
MFGDVKGNNNRFEVITVSEVNFECGIAYYDCGIKPHIVVKDKNNKLFLGFEKNIICVDMSLDNIVFEKKLTSIFYEFIEVQSQNAVIAICELDIYVFNYEGKILWEMGLREVINEFYVIEDEKLCIVYDDGDELIFSITEGKVIN